ncbi:MAG: orotate phosphoribosyltransferase, partial [Candidatus Methanospirareceae archaeon]
LTKEKLIWLPRQEQLQNLLDVDFYYHAFVLDEPNNAMRDIYSNDGLSSPFESGEQFWFAFVMWEKFEKVWDEKEEKWVKERREGMEKRERLKEIIKERALIIREKPDITLSSGMKSNFYFDMKNVLLCPEGANLVAEEIIKRLRDVHFDYVGGMESGSIPIVTLICANSAALGRHIEGFFVRKEEKDHGMRKGDIGSEKIVGNLKRGSNVVIVEDVTTTGGSVMKAINEVEKVGCKVVKVITIVDRCEGAKEKSAKLNIEFDALFTLGDFGL